MHSPLSRLLVRWFVCSLGLWIAANFLSGSISYNRSLGVVIVAGLVLALINTIIKPLLVLFSFPAVLLTLGLFLIIINGVTVYLASVLYHPLHITSFWAAVFAGMVIGLVNYLVTTILEDAQ